MRITVVGGLLIIAGIVLAVLVLDALLRHDNGHPKPNNPQFPEDGHSGSSGA